MRTFRPCLPHDAVRYTGSSGRVLVVNPNSRRWVVTNEPGEAILGACNGIRSVEEVTSEFGLSAPQRKQFADLAEGLLKAGVLSVNSELGEGQTSLKADGLALLALHLEVTNRCNLRCAHCYVSAGRQLQNELTLGEIRRLVNEFTGLVASDATARIAITGGEARLRPDYLDIVAYCRNRGLETVLFTNGVGWTEGEVSRLADLDAEVQVSLDAPDAESNDVLRGRGTFQQIVTGVDLFLAHGFGPRMILFVTLTRNSISRALELFRFAEERGIGSIHFSQINAQGRAITNWRELAPTPSQWVDFGLRCEQEQALGKVRLKGNVFGGLDMSPGLFPKALCGIPMSPRVDCQGNVQPCQLFVGSDHLLGNIRQQSLADIIQSQRTRTIVADCAQRSRQIPGCASCQWQPVCGSGCAGHALSEFGTLNREDSFCVVRRYWFETKARAILGLPPLDLSEQ